MREYMRIVKIYMAEMQRNFKNKRIKSEILFDFVLALNAQERASRADDRRSKNAEESV